MFNWGDYLVLAEELANRQDEASQRSAVSRTYYAVFCTARNALTEKGEWFPQTGESHRKVWNKLQEMGRKRIAEFGRSLRNARRKADYDNDIANLPKIVEDAGIKARRILSDLQDV